MSHEPVSLTDAKVLLVDDTSANLDLLADFLGPQGYKLSFATHGEKALQIAVLDLPDLILLDVMMPGMDGFETCRRLKSIKDTRHIPVIFVTGKTDIEDIIKGFEVGGVDYINKPIRREEVLARVRTQLQLQRLLVQRDELICQLRQHSAKQQHSIESQEAELMQARRMASLAESVAEFAHEVNTPVSTCLTSSTFLESQIDTLEQQFNDGNIKKADLQHFIDSVKESVKVSVVNLHQTAELIQSFKRVTVGQCHQTRSKFVLRQALESVILSLRPKLKKKKHQVELSCPDTLEITTIAGALYQVISNLTSNAIQHGFDEIEQGLINIDVHSEGDQICIDFADNGKGIAEEDKRRIFEKYFTTKASQGGSGIGLYVVYRMISETLGGTLEVDSTPGRGTTFKIRLPAELKN